MAESPAAPMPSAPPSGAPEAGAALEKRVGERWFSKIGIASIFVATLSLVKYAFDSSLLGPVARGGLIVAVGAALLGVVKTVAVDNWALANVKSIVPPAGSLMPAFALHIVAPAASAVVLWRWARPDTLPEKFWP